tara:strand:+ start:3701 stop:4453 length:753 start_codon:yes stop_codon:yes gene_type:complete
MNYKLITILFSFFFLYACSNQNITFNKKDNFIIEKKYNNKGFTHVFDKNVDKFKSLDERSLDIYHKSLKKNSNVKIINLNNGKYLIAKVKSNRVKFPDFYNSIISSRIAETLDIDIQDPYVEIILISNNSSFIAKKAKTFDQEKEVAAKAPIAGIIINDLNKKPKKNKIVKNQKFSYSIKIADFYYENTAQMMTSRIKEETSLKNYKIIKLSEKNYRVLIGPFNDINSLKKSFEEIKLLNFENLEILKNV